MKIKIILPVVGLLLLTRLSAPGAAVVYEGFDYGAVGGTMNGKTVSANAVGLTGSYGSAISGAAATTDYVTTGLTFSNNFLPTQGGALTVSVSPNSATLTGAATLGVQLSAGTLTGNVYGSYLFNISTSTINSSSDFIQSRLSNTQTTSSSQRLTMAGDSGNSADGVAVSYASATSAQTGILGSTTLNLNTTYLLIGRWTNVGGGATGGTATMWFLTPTAYDNWQSLGGGSEASLDTYATGRTQRSEAVAIDFNSGNFLQFQAGVGATGTTGNLTGTFDEFRFATDLASVTSVPEPATSTFMIGLGVISVIGVVRRMRRIGQVA